MRLHRPPTLYTATLAVCGVSLPSGFYKYIYYKDFYTDRHRPPKCVCGIWRSVWQRPVPGRA